MVTYESLRHNEDINAYIRKADESLRALGFTEHSFAHVTLVAETARRILSTLQFPAHDIELARIAAHLHDIGNVVNRIDHSQSGAVMAFRLLDNLQMPADDIATIVTAIGNHDEGTGVPVNSISAALILADKSDVRRSRVRNPNPAAFDIHDQVNYAVSHTHLDIDPAAKSVLLSILLDTEFSSVMDFFAIFLGRMKLCRQAAKALGLTFHLSINGQQLA